MKRASPVSKQRADDLRFLTEHEEAEREEERKKRLAEIQGRSSERVKAEAKATLRLLKNRAEQEFVKAGGDIADFQSLWDSGLKEKLLIEHVSKFVTLPQPSLVRDF